MAVEPAGTAPPRDLQADWSGDTGVHTENFAAHLNDWAAAFQDGGRCP